MNHNLDSAILDDYVHGSATTAKNGFRLAVGIKRRGGRRNAEKNGDRKLAEKSRSNEDVEDARENDSSS